MLFSFLEGARLSSTVGLYREVVGSGVIGHSPLERRPARILQPYLRVKGPCNIP